MTPRYRKIPIIIAFVIGGFIGCICDLIVAGIGGLLQSLASWFFPSLPSPPELIFLIFGLAAVALPVWLAISFALDEKGKHAIEYRAVTNRCYRCGYSLRGIRRESDRCPECGLMFQKLP